MKKQLLYMLCSVVLGLLFLVPGRLAAQAGDSLAVLRDFVNISNVYRQLPVRAEISLRNSTDFVTAKEDTTEAVIRFYLRKEAAYMQYNGMEQLVNDSLVLVVNKDAERMILHANNQPVAARMAQYTGLALPDSSLQKIARLFTAAATGKDKSGMAGIELKSRTQVYGSMLPVQSIVLRYKENKEPVLIVQTKRSLVAIAAERYHQLLQDSAWTNRLLAAPDGKHFFVRKEQVATFTYTKIDHAANLPVPAQVTDRIGRDETGKYAPVKAYKAFVLTQDR